MKSLTTNEAREYIKWAATLNPGPWIEHSKIVAYAAEKIAEKCNLDSDKAYAIGLVHDIGRYKGVSSLKHVYDGFNLLKKEGYDEAAKICITHSFPLKNFKCYSGLDDCSEKEREIIKSELMNAQYTDYDFLIQLCDSLSLPSGICLMEKRLVDVAMRHGINELMLEKWNSLFKILNYFSNLSNTSVYELFPEVLENTFGNIKFENRN